MTHSQPLGSNETQETCPNKQELETIVKTDVVERSSNVGCDQKEVEVSDTTDAADVTQTRIDTKADDAVTSHTDENASKSPAAGSQSRNAPAPSPAIPIVRPRVPPPPTAPAPSATDANGNVPRRSGEPQSDMTLPVSLDTRFDKGYHSVLLSSPRSDYVDDYVRNLHLAPRNPDADSPPDTLPVSPEIKEQEEVQQNGNEEPARRESPVTSPREKSRSESDLHVAGATLGASMTSEALSDLSKSDLHLIGEPDSSVPVF